MRVEYTDLSSCKTDKWAGKALKTVDESMGKQSQCQCLMIICTAPSPLFC